MPINIRNREVERLLDELKAETGQGTTEIVLELTRREVARRRRLRTLDERRRQVDALAARYRARLGEHPESPDDIIGYDEHGLPR